MGSYLKYCSKFRSLSLILGFVICLGFISSNGWAAKPKHRSGGTEREVTAPQRFKATVDDGTAKVIRADTQVDEETTVAAPEKLEQQASTASDANEINEIDDLKRQNSALAKRLEALERAKATADEPIADAADENAQDRDVAEGAEPMNDEPSKDEDALVDSDPTIPTDTVESRLKEKAKVSRQARAELAKQAQREKKAGTFDAVPDPRIPELAERLKFTNDILKRFGRAYDYRSTTLKEFKKILAALESEAEKNPVTN